MYCILVVYNKSVKDSVAYQFVSKYSWIRLIVVDNSTADFNNALSVKQDGHIYICMNGNQGLSKAYNKALDSIFDKSGYVILLDDDTVLSTEYFEEIKNINCDIALPIVKDERNILSPSEFKHGYSQRWNGRDKIVQLTGINSGMVINLKLFEKYRYDEKLFLDNIDHQFLMDMKDKNIKVLKSVIHQCFSGNSVDFEKAKIRFKIYKKDCGYFYRNNKLLGFWVMNKHRLNLVRRYKKWIG